MTSSGLRLRAESEDDLSVLGGILQDALLPVGDIAYLDETNEFAMAANRFCWEAEKDDAAADKGRPTHLRINCGVLFSDVKSVQTRGFDRKNDENILSLLTIRTKAGVEGAEITLICAGDASIRLYVGSIQCRLDDMGEPWPTVWRPAHGGGDAD